MEMLTLYTQLSSWRVVVLASKLGCDSNLARTTHDNVAGMLAQMTGDLRRIMESERAVAAAIGTPDEDAVAEVLFRLKYSFERNWRDVYELPTIDDTCVNASTNEYWDPRTLDWRTLTDDIMVIDVPDSTLCGLRTIIDRIARETGVVFTACQVIYRSTERDAQRRDAIKCRFDTAAN